MCLSIPVDSATEVTETFQSHMYQGQGEIFATVLSAVDGFLFGKGYRGG